MMVRPATADDIEAIADLNVEAYREFADRMTPDNWQKMEASIRSIEARTRSTRFLVMRDQGTIVGSVGYCPAGRGNPEIFPQDWATMLVLAVDPAHRGRGIAKALGSACIACARHDSARVIGLFTSELMTSAQQLYESLGFRRERELPPRLGLRYWRYKLDL
ncbi:MAG TPA: GNAT family N-acetyltransferase [Nitrospiraceae bacterium]|jgi:ribosomal protein S18 acetylase RimI-like enzyme|nr:GNAT family N-acetyltransferase [Nitrospiraceae bacterium]